jgi:hypothetical protein
MLGVAAVLETVDLLAFEAGELGGIIALDDVLL